MLTRTRLTTAAATAASLLAVALPAGAAPAATPVVPALPKFPVAPRLPTFTAPRLPTFTAPRLPTFTAPRPPTTPVPPRQQCGPQTNKFVPPAVGPITVDLGPTIIQGRVMNSGVHVSSLGISSAPICWKSS
jgi:hypothetical protein